MSERPKRVDFHIHYNPADERTAYDAIKIASERNIIAMTVLARSEISGNIDAFIEYGEDLGVTVVPGVEFLAKLGDESVNFILLGFNHNNEKIKEYFGRDGISQNKKRAHFQRDFLISKGFILEGLDDDKRILLARLLSGEISEKAINFCNIVASLPVNVDVINELKTNYYFDWQSTVNRYGNKLNYSDPIKLCGKFLYEHFFQVGCEGYQEVRTDSKKVIEFVHHAGGVVLYSPEGEFRMTHWKDLLSQEVDGIMAWHAGLIGANGKNIPDIQRNVIIETRRKGLLVLGGSDYQQKDWEIGIGNGNMYISPKRYLEFMNYIKRKNGGNIPWLK